MNRRLGILVVLIVAVAGCSRGAAPPAESTQSAQPTQETTSEVAAPTPQGVSANIPDPCTLMSDAEVTSLTGRDITQIDRDGADPTATTRYCQWQQSGGQLAVFVTRTTADDFTSAQAGAPPIPGLGDAAFDRDGHLFVLVGTIQLDVYVSAGDEQQNQAEAEKVAAALLPKVKAFA
ncbi:DUF3558 domain-containing protein [Mycolicibacterium moriokaense]|nr:DUF3558 domain-containing protein [Mycolicibacterium moriokaense]